MRVLLLEDDENTRLAVTATLRGAGFATDAVADLRTAHEAMTVNSYDCAVLDRMVPGGDALDLVRGLRRAGWGVPVLFMTALDDLADRLEGLRLATCDYLVKPFSMDELVARVRRMCLWVVPGPPSVLRCGDLELDPGRREVRRAGALLSLTKTQFAVLELLLVRAPEPVPTKELIRSVWDEVDPNPNRVQVLIGELRRNLHDPPIIHTVRGIGYRIGV